MNKVGGFFPRVKIANLFRVTLALCFAACWQAIPVGGARAETYDARTVSGGTAEAMRDEQAGPPSRMKRE